jgi:hypothetical protein
MKTAPPGWLPSVGADPEALINSDHPATAEFAQSLRQICGDHIAFRNLDVAAAAQM